MRIELLHIDDCPNTAKALEQVEAALAALGRDDVPVQLRLIESAAETAGTGFAGSPTITADGADIFPDGGVPAAAGPCSARSFMPSAPNPPTFACADSPQTAAIPGDVRRFCEIVG